METPNDKEQTPATPPAPETPATPPAPTIPPAGEMPPATPVTAQELVKPLGDAMPPVTPGSEAPAETPPETKAETPPPASLREYRDAKGTLFDPLKHAANEDGTPRLDKHQRFYSRGLGKHGAAKLPPGTLPPVSAPRPPPTFSAPAGGGLPVEDGETDVYGPMAEMYLQSGYGPLILLLSEDARPDKDEHAALKQTLAAWLRASGATEISPGWAFALLATAIIVKKTEKPKVRERLTLWAMRVKGWFNKKLGGK